MWQLTKVLVQFSILLATFSVAIRPAGSHDAVGMIKQEMQSAVPALDAARSATATSDDATRSVLANLLLWPVPHRLTVCFLKGDAAVRHAVVESMRRSWPLGELTEGRLDFNAKEMDSVPDCSAATPADIKIDFQDGGGYWSYVGVESIKFSPSMNFGGFTTNLPQQKELDRLVGHETGHAIGLEHEHQSPGAPDCNWDFDYIYTHYLWTSRDEMMENFTKLQDYIQNDRHAFVFSTYDQKSLMHYAFEPEAFKSGKSPCLITQNYVPSDQDKNAIRVAYGSTALSIQDQTRGMIPALSKMYSDTKYTKLRDMLNLKADLFK